MQPIEQLQLLSFLVCCNQKWLASGLLLCCVAGLVDAWGEYAGYIHCNRTTSKICTNLCSHVGSFTMQVPGVVCIVHSLYRHGHQA